MAVPLLPDRMLAPARRFAVRALKVHPGQVAVLAGCRAAWALDVVHDLVAEAGTVVVIEADPGRAVWAGARVNVAGWSNVAVLAGPPHGGDLPGRVDRLLFDDDDLLEDAVAVARVLSPLGPAGRVAAVCHRGGGRPWRHLEDRVPTLQREPFYLGAAFAVWGQLP